MNTWKKLAALVVVSMPLSLLATAPDARAEEDVEEAEGALSSSHDSRARCYDECEDNRRDCRRERRRDDRDWDRDRDWSWDRDRDRDGGGYRCGARYNACINYCDYRYGRRYWY
jgi:hypothetical protein